ncbi:hypothetical protein LXD69_05205 [Flavobacterium sediminilitoris]|uniref:Uncharacterized protein n=2 Tax=Flavobacterium TaxID=237 RepID=A0ABY4HQL9_9FLAO|nr:hypothetical protein [Flavobacterium sediminilitoris]UOX34910.1 hypothetical protein LXD69_05205 [Flavobacterium sediminilitoris]
MKYIILFLFFSIFSHSQISLGNDLRNNEIKKYDDGRINTFKNTETIFIFSNFIDKKIMEDILSKSWTVTPFSVVSINDFKMINYLNGDYSFATYQNQTLTFSKKKTHKNLSHVTLNNASSNNPNRSGTSGNIVNESDRTSTRSYYSNYFDFFLIDKESYTSTSKRYEVFKNHRIEICNFLMSDNFLVYFDYFFSPSTFMTDLTSFNNDIYNNLYNEDFMYDNKPGFLLNNIQRINSFIENETKISAFSEFVNTESIKVLKDTKLIIPYEVYCYYDIRVLQKKKNDYSKLNKKYDYDYEVLNSNLISDKIMKGEDFYYLKFNLIETDKILQVVHSTDGGILYSKRFSGMIEQLPNKAIEDLNNEIKNSN